MNSPWLALAWLLLNAVALAVLVMHARGRWSRHAPIHAFERLRAATLVWRAAVKAVREAPTPDSSVDVVAEPAAPRANESIASPLTVSPPSETAPSPTSSGVPRPPRPRGVVKLAADVARWRRERGKLLPPADEPCRVGESSPNARGGDRHDERLRQAPRRMARDLIA